MSRVVQFLIIFIVLAAAGFILTEADLVKYGTEDYWDHHGFLFLFFITIFPRLTLLFSSVASGGFFWWLSWLFIPRILVAILATVTYWFQNPVLVVIAWIVAIGGESTEKVVMVRRNPIHRVGYRPPRNADVIDVTHERK